MLIRGCRLGRYAAAILAALALSATAPAPASAQGLFEALFGGFRSRARALPPQALPFAEPFGMLAPAPRRSHEPSGPSTGYCVRTCDGRFFPIQRSANASVAELCKSFCPATPTLIFHGSKIDHAVGPKGVRYSELKNAFVYRKQVVDNCTCNGRDPFGLVRMDVKQDPTLKAGDIVATTDGLATVKNPKTAELVPVNPSSKLADIQVTPISPQPKVEPVADEMPLRTNRQVQLSR